MTDREVMQQALEALEEAKNGSQKTPTESVINALRTPPQQQAEPVAKYKVTVIDDHHPAGVPLEQWGKKQAEPVAWDKPSASFNGWWDSYHHDPANPFAEGLAAYWAWAGWKAAQRQWVGLTDEDYLNALDLHPHEGTDREFWNVLEAKLKEKNNG